MVTENVQVFKLLLFELAFDTVIVEDIIHNGISHYTKLAFNSLKMVRNGTVSQLSKQGMVGL